jgi:hypothetical protein
MSREIKRVSLKFDWPIGKVWMGYVNPYNSIECPYCNATGGSKEAQELENKWFNWDGPREKAWQHNLDEDDIKELIKNDRLKDLTYEFKDNKWVKIENKIITPEMVNEWSYKNFGHDAINRWICIKAKCKKMGVPERCKHCEGDGFIFANDKVKKLYKNWEKIEPPKGNGYQLWETTSEGSPKSPVFKNVKDLAKWLCDNKVSIFGKDMCSAEEWEKCIKINNFSHIIGQKDNTVMVAV